MSRALRQLSRAGSSRPSSSLVAAATQHGRATPTSAATAPAATRLGGHDNSISNGNSNSYTTYGSDNFNSSFNSNSAGGTLIVSADGARSKNKQFGTVAAGRTGTAPASSASPAPAAVPVVSPLAAPLSGAKRTVSSSTSGGASLLSSPSARAGARGVSTVDGGGAQLAARVDAVVIGAGQAGLSVAYHLQRAGGLRFVTLDANQEAGGAWRHRWPSLELFSTRKWSSLPGYPMFANGACEDGYPSTREMAMYMEEYEQVMKLNVVRPVTVTGVTRTTMGTFLVETDCLLGGTPARWEARTVISSAGTHTAPVWPRLPGSDVFRGVQIHSSQYRYAEDFRGARVAVVGAGNSGAQILAEVSQIGMAKSAMWSTLGEPSFLPVGLSGKEIFDTVARLRQRQGFVREGDIPSLNSVIMQPGVVEAAERGVYDNRVSALTRLTNKGVAWEASPDGSIPAGEAEVDAIIWCTGYRSNTSHLSRLGLVQQDSTVAMDGQEMGETDMPGVFAVGYGNWAGVGSGSIPGSTFYAKRAAAAAVQHLRGGNSYDSSHVAVAAAMAGQGQLLALNGSPAGSRAWPSAGRLSAVTMSGGGGGRSSSSVGVPGVSGYGQASAGGREHERVAVAA